MKIAFPKLRWIANGRALWGSPGPFATLNADMARLYGGDQYAGLTTKTTSFWPLNEVTGATRSDAKGTNHLTNHPGDGTGCSRDTGFGVDFSTLFVPGHPDYLNIASNSTLQTGTGLFHICAWVKGADVQTVNRDIISKDSGSAAGYGLRIFGGKFQCLIRQSSGVDCVRFAHGTTLVNNTVYFVEMWWDGTNGNLRVNATDSNRVTTAGTGTPANETAEFSIGRDTVGIGASWSGNIQAVTWAQGVNFTLAEAQLLYHSGVPLRYLGNGSWG